MVNFLGFLILLLVLVNMEPLINPRISNGVDSVLFQFLFMASIQLKIPPSTVYVHECGGTVLHDYWVLSSASCVIKTRGNVTARVHIHMHFTEKNDSRVQIIYIASTIVHENYKSSINGKPNDIGMIRLESPIIRHVAAKLPQPRNPEVNNVWIIGWGRTSAASDGNIPEVLQHASVRILDNQKCQQLLQNSHQLRDSHICTYSPRRPVTGCKGDGGGPVIRFMNDEPGVIGILSWTLVPCGQVGAPTISTRVSYYNNWILDKMRKVANKMFENNSLLTPLLVSP